MVSISPFSAIDPLIQGNFIGTDKTGSIALPNSGSGMVVFHE